ncbi:hypothetical protein GCM10027446_17850 [Angustibacter peucedani]
MSGLDLWRRHRQVVGLAVLAVLAALGCVGLGRWQWHRYQAKHDARQLVERSFAAPAVPLADLLASTSAPLAHDDGWRPVRVSGRYDVGRTVLVRNRPRDVGDTGPAYGYEVLVPLVLADGSALLVDRGWVPNGTTGDRPGQEPDAVPAPTTADVEVVARLRPGEPARAVQVPAGQVASIDLGRVAALTGRPLYRAYGVLVSESPATSPAPALIGRPELDGGEGINASYAVQWVLFALLALGFPFWWVRRTRREAALSATDPDDVDATRTPVPAAPRRRRIWDDEEA